MKRPDQDKLLREMLSGEEVSDFRNASLAGGLASLRKRRRYRRAAQAGVVMVLTLLVAIGIVREHGTVKPARTAREMASIKPPPATAAASPAPSAETSPVKTISDEELFALFPGRSMALIGSPGRQQLVFLDGGAARAKAR